MDSWTTNSETAIQLLHKENDELKEKAERLENHSRKYSLQEFGLSADVEKGNLTICMPAHFKELFKDKLLLELENAHRVGHVAKSGNRAMIVRMRSCTHGERGYLRHI